MIVQLLHYPKTLVSTCQLSQLLLPLGNSSQLSHLRTPPHPQGTGEGENFIFQSYFQGQVGVTMEDGADGVIYHDTLNTYSDPIIIYLLTGTSTF